MRNLAILCLLGLAAAAQAAPPAAPQSSYAQSLADRGDWYRAITETYRESFLADRSNRSGLLDLRLGELYLKAGNYGKARNHLLIFMKQVRQDDSASARVKTLIARTYELEKDYRNAYFQMEAVRFPEGSEAGYSALLKRFELKLKFPVTEPGLLAADWLALTNARAGDYRSKYSAELTLLGSKKNEAGRLRKKSAFMTGLCSVIPGLNMVYLGKYRQGLVNFTAHAALIGLTWYEFDRKEYVGGTILGLTELSWYMYNFTSGFEGLRDYNMAKEREFQASFSLDIEF